MSNRRSLWVWTLLLAAGCATEHPFRSVSLVPLPPESATAVYAAVDAALPTRFTILTSVVFQYRGRSMTAMGLTRVDTAAPSYSVVAMSPLGAKLFKLRGDASGDESLFVAEELKEKADPTGTMARDVRAIYLDPLPAPPMEHWQEQGTVVFEKETSNGRLEYTLGGSPPVLIKKRLRDAHGTVWTITYHEYEKRNGNLFPGGIVLQHSRYGYRLVIRLKKIIEPPEQAEPPVKEHA